MFRNNENTYFIILVLQNREIIIMRSAIFPIFVERISAVLQVFAKIMK